MRVLHFIASMLGIPKAKRNGILAAWRRYTHWKPAFYREAKEFGLNNSARDKKIVVSLTSYPARISTVYQTINTLLMQTMKPDAIVLWLARDQFPRGLDDLPPQLRKLMPLGLSVEWCKDIWSYKKLLPALKSYPNDLIITVDDDLFYRPDMVEKLITAYKVGGDAIYTHSAMKIKITADGIVEPYITWKYVSEAGDRSFANLVLGGSGTMYPAWLLTKEIYEEEKFRKIAPTTDDMWFWAMSVLSNLKIFVVHGGEIDCATNYNANYSQALWNSNQKNENGNDDQFKMLLEAYPIVKERLMSDVI